MFRNALVAVVLLVAWLGVAPRSHAALLDIGIQNTPDGVGVESVSRGGLGDRMGLEPGDIITRINGTDIGNVQDVQNVLQNAGNTLRVDFIRGDNGRRAHSKARKERRTRLLPNGRPVEWERWVVEK